ncbi:MAG: hypothetical protein AVDCRST_MAG76-1394, partial [uncultured Acidimicrobiales bacterium]
GGRGDRDRGRGRPVAAGPPRPGRCALEVRHRRGRRGLKGERGPPAGAPAGRRPRRVRLAPRRPDARSHPERQARPGPTEDGGARPTLVGCRRRCRPLLRRRGRCAPRCLGRAGGADRRAGQDRTGRAGGRVGARPGAARRHRGRRAHEQPAGRGPQPAASHRRRWRRAHGQGARGAGSAGPGTLEQADRPGPLRQRRHDQDPPAAHLREARRPEPLRRPDEGDRARPPPL